MQTGTVYLYLLPICFFIKGILTQREGDLIEETVPVTAQPFLPLIWTSAIVMRAEQDGFIQNPHALVNLISVS